VWWLERAAEYLRPSTMRGYREHVHRSLLPFLGHLDLADANPRDVQVMLRKLAGHRTAAGSLLAPATIARVLATLRSALSAAVREGLITVNPAAAGGGARPTTAHAVVWTPPREHAWRSLRQRPSVAVWDRHHLVAFLEDAREDRLFALWWIAALFGLRRGEPAGLRWCDIDLDAAMLTVTVQIVCVDGEIHADRPRVWPAVGRCRWTMPRPPWWPIIADCSKWRREPGPTTTAITSSPCGMGGRYCPP